jgi:hypothetical protein
MSVAARWTAARSAVGTSPEVATSAEGTCSAEATWEPRTPPEVWSAAVRSVRVSWGWPGWPVPGAAPAAAGLAAQALRRADGTNDRWACDLGRRGRERCRATSVLRAARFVS